MFIASFGRGNYSLLMDRRCGNYGRCFTRKGSKWDVLEEIVLENKFKQSQTKDNLVVYDNDEFRVKNLVPKKTREQKGR